MKRTAFSVLMAAFVILIFWVGGMEFERGSNQALCLIFAFVAAGFAYAFPGWDDP